MEKSNIQKIPKLIHFVWLGGEKPEVAKKCIESWKKFCPDFEIMEWNEKNFDINSHPFVLEAYQHKKWAFASDYIRLYVVEKYGGIYFDSDVEVVKDLTPLLQHESFFCFEHSALVATSTFGCVKNHPVIQEFLKLYQDRHFVKKNGKFNTNANTELLTALLKFRHGLKVDNSLQELDDGVVVFPNEYFCPKNYMTGKVHKTQNTYCIHHFDGSWLKESKKKMDKFFGKIVSCIGEKNAQKFSNMYFKNHLKKVWRQLNNKK